MRYLVALHHAEHWWFYPHWRRDYDTGIGRWLQVNGEAIFDTTPWKLFGEGPNTVTGGDRISEKRSSITYTGADVRYTCKGDTPYAICLGRPAGEVILRDAARRELRIRAPRRSPADEAVAFRINRR